MLVVGSLLGFLVFTRWHEELNLLTPHMDPRRLGLVWATRILSGALGGQFWGHTNTAAYLFAALGYYASGAVLSARKGGGVGWFLFALAFSIPSVFLVHFDANWWQNPSASEGAMAGLMAGAGLLLAAVWELRKRPPEFMDVEVTPETMANPAVAAAVAARQAPLSAGAEKPAKVKKKHLPLFVPDIVVQRQRAMFIALARRRKVARAAVLARHQGERAGEEEAA